MIHCTVKWFLFFLVHLQLLLTFFVEILRAVASVLFNSVHWTSRCDFATTLQLHCVVRCFCPFYSYCTHTHKHKCPPLEIWFSLFVHQHRVVCSSRLPSIQPVLLVYAFASLHLRRRRRSVCCVVFFFLSSYFYFTYEKLSLSQNIIASAVRHIQFGEREMVQKKKKWMSYFPFLLALSSCLKNNIPCIRQTIERQTRVHWMWPKTIDSIASHRIASLNVAKWIYYVLYSTFQNKQIHSHWMAGTFHFIDFTLKVQKILSVWNLVRFWFNSTWFLLLLLVFKKIHRIFPFWDESSICQIISTHENILKRKKTNIKRNDWNRKIESM